jgi:starvation-inducible DNA-binding protein
MTEIRTDDLHVEVDTGAVAAALDCLLADTYVLYVKTQGFHWNVTGPQFGSLHQMFEEQYTELAAAVDEIAERTRALGHRALGSFTEFSRTASVSDAPTETPGSMEMVRILTKDHLTVASSARAVFSEADRFDDQATADLANDRSRSHEKAAWMLRSYLE